MPLLFWPLIAGAGVGGFAIGSVTSNLISNLIKLALVLAAGYFAYTVYG